MGRRRARVPLPLRDLGLQHGPLPPARGRRGAEAGGAAAARLEHFYTEPMVRLAERITARSLGGKVYFCNSGAEANEAALKARPQAAAGRALRGAQLHGRTYGALSATPQETKQAPFAPLVPGFDADLPAAAPGQSTATRRAWCSS